MTSLGIFEIFYGTIWSATERSRFCSFCKDAGFEFYLYGPKMDESLRKNWHKALTGSQVQFLTDMREDVQSKGLKFGVALSPQGLLADYGAKERWQLIEKVKSLSALGLDFLGLFFDDMKSSEDMADRQMAMLADVRAATNVRIVFCPSYYANDPMLDAMFGDRPARYLESLGQGLAQDVDVVWTGEQIISLEIKSAELDTISQLLRRKPLLCDNFFADDGPINCNFLRLVPTTGRSRDVFSKAKAWALNPMNQMALSQIAFLSFMQFVKGEKTPAAAFQFAVENLVEAPVTATFIQSYAQKFSEEGLIALDPSEKLSFMDILAPCTDPFSLDLKKWLAGEYTIDLMAMLEQGAFGINE